MTTAWPNVRLGDVLRRSGETTEIQPHAEYREVTVRLWGNGVVERGRLDGAEISGNRRAIARTGQFIVSRIDARNGAMGIVPAALDGAVVTNDFPLFAIDARRLLPAYLGWLCRTSGFVELCHRASEGTTNRVRLKEGRFLALEIPLPPLAEQRRIVARIDELAAYIHEAHDLRREALVDADVLLLNHATGVFEELSKQHGAVEFSTFQPHITSGPRNWAKHYEEQGLRFYRAQDIGPNGAVLDDSKAFLVPPPGAQGRSATLEVGDLMIVITGATVGRVALYRSGLEPGLVSQHVSICRLPKDQANPEFTLWGLRSSLGKDQLLGQRYGQGKPGLNLRNIGALKLPFPALARQDYVVAGLDALEAEVDVLKQRQAEANAELDALLPSILGYAFSGNL